MHVINWSRFCDLARGILLANKGLQLSEDLFDKLTSEGAFNPSPNIQFRPEIAPSRPEVFIRAFESFHGKMISIDTKKLHLDMIEGKDFYNQCSSITKLLFQWSVY